MSRPVPMPPMSPLSPGPAAVDAAAVRAPAAGPVMPATALAHPACRVMAVADLDAVMAVEVASYSHPWTRGNFIDALAAGYRAEVLLWPDGVLAGYSLAMAGVEETHLLNLTVAPGRRRGGLGRLLLQRVAAAARARGDGRLWLEVRASNAPARALYAAAGFRELGLRRGYYPADRLSREDAVVMCLDLSPLSPADAGAPPDALD